MADLTKGKGVNACEDKIRTGLDVIRGGIQDIYIMKRLLVANGVASDVIDGFIDLKSGEYDALYATMDKSAFDDAVDRERSRVEEADRRAEAETAGDKAEQVLQGDVPVTGTEQRLTGYDHAACGESENDPMMIIRSQLELIDRKLNQIMMVKKSLTIAGAAHKMLAKLIADASAAANELFMSVTEEELDSMIAGRISEA